MTAASIFSFACPCSAKKEGTHCHTIIHADRITTACLQLYMSWPSGQQRPEHESAISKALYPAGSPEHMHCCEVVGARTLAQVLAEKLVEMESAYFHLVLATSVDARLHVRHQDSF